MFSNLCVFGKCENIYGMFRCICDKGFTLDESGGNCTDIDECENPQACQYGNCINSQGSYVCQCPPHHELIPSQNGCVGKFQIWIQENPLIETFKFSQTNEWELVTWMSSKLQQVETFALIMWTISYLDPLAVAPSVKLGDLNVKFVQLQTLMNSKLYVRLDQDLDPTWLP